MNDYTFGNKILELRTQLNLSQTELAQMVGVTNKAVSKWETGKSKPTTNVIRKLAALFKIDINELLSTRGEEKNEDFKDCHNRRPLCRQVHCYELGTKRIHTDGLCRPVCA